MPRFSLEAPHDESTQRLVDLESESESKIHLTGDGVTFQLGRIEDPGRGRAFGENH